MFLSFPYFVVLTPIRLGGVGAESCNLGDPLGGPIDEEGKELSPPSPTLLRRGRDPAGHRPRRGKHGEVLPLSLG